MKLAVVVALACLSAVAADDFVIFRGTPTTRVYTSTESETRVKLDEDAAKKAECVIVMRGNKLYWASRDNGLMTRVDATQYTYFIHARGGGFVKVFTGDRKQDAPADYVETITQGLDVIAYWGRALSP